jgi:tRNA dimethylallyltransferase
MQPKAKKCKIIVLIGQTASGKTSTAIKLAKDVGGEVVSADSRQVYRGLDIGSDKVSKKEMQGVPHHLLDVANPLTETYTVNTFVQDATKAIQDICSRGKVPIVAGGTMLYIDALFGNVLVPEVEPDHALRAKLEQRGSTSLFAELEEKDPRRAKQMQQEGQDANKRRLVRALEIVSKLGSVPQSPTQNDNVARGPLATCEVLWLGLHNDQTEQKTKINKRNAEMLKPKHRGKASVLDEVQDLIDIGVSQKQFDTFGFEYKYPALYLAGKPIIQDEEPTLEQELMKMNSGTWRYAKKQRAWWQGRTEIQWFKAAEYRALAKVANTFLQG